MKKILIVEDDFILTMINRKHLELMGHIVIGTATNGPDAIKAAKELQPEVILMDVRLNGPMTGIEAMLEISKFSNAYVIYLTGNTPKEFEEQTSKTNMLAFCSKPVHFEELSKILDKIN